ncbi:hypothetical protein NL676_017674 [Syzygium grande]|nr:hypothetical protein NL676_017674 [Syzygium grande]
MPDLGEKVRGCTDRDFMRDYLVEISKLLRCDLRGFVGFGVEVEEPSSSVFKDDHRSMVFGAKVEEPSSVVEDDRDLHDDHAIPQFSSLCNACGIKSRRKRRAVMNKIEMEIKKARRSNSSNGGSLKRRVLA